MTLSKLYTPTLPWRAAAAIAAVALTWIAIPIAPAAAAREDDMRAAADPLARAKRNLVAVIDWDKIDGKAYLGSGVLLQRDKVLISCHIANARNLGVTQDNRRSEARLTNERHGRGLCELKISHPVHFDPLPIEIRPIEEVSVGQPVYAVATASGREVSMVKARISGIRSAGDDKVIRISQRLNAAYAGGALFDQSGALIGINALRDKPGEEAAFTYPMEYFLQVEEQKAQQSKVTTPPWEDTKPPAQLQVAAEANQRPKTARVQPLPPKTSPDNLAYKQAVKEYLEDIVRASTKHVMYPDSARKSRWTGTSSIWFRLNSGGELGESFVDTTSGYATLDVAALLAVRKAISDLPPPPMIRDRGMMATVAVTFALADR